jgi:hypothetical protein
MEEIQNKIESIVPPTSIATNELKEETNQLPWILLGVAILLVIISGGLLVWKITNKKPDLVIYAPEKVSPSITPTLTIEGTTQEFVFESKPYRSEKDNFQINVPQGWNVDSSENSGAAVILIDPNPVLASGSAIYTFINVAVSKPSGETLEGYVKQTREGLKNIYDSYVIEEDKILILRGVTYHLIGGSYMARGIKMKNRNILLLYNQRGYAIAATSPDSVWLKNELLLNATILSFKNF